MRWNEEAADVYTPDGAFLLECLPTSKAHKSEAEATPETFAALGKLSQRKRTMVETADKMRDDVLRTLEVIAAPLNPPKGGSEDAEMMQYDDYVASTKGSVKKDGYNAQFESPQATPDLSKGGERKAKAKKDERTMAQKAFDDI